MGVYDFLHLMAVFYIDMSVVICYNIEDVKYQILPNGGYEVNVPFVKSYSEGGSNILVPGYIAHISINREFEIYSIYETKPYSGAP